MVFVDTHCHLDLLPRSIDVVERAKEKRVIAIVSNGVNVETNRKTLQLAQEFSSVKAALGLYPIEALKMSDKEIDEEIEFIRQNKSRIVAIGEVGLDLKEDTANLERQKEIFKKFAELAKELDKPIIVHSRKAELQTIEVLESVKAKKVIMHCFTGKTAYVQRVLQNGWHLSIPTSVKHSVQFQTIVKYAPIEQLLCETDAPYLHPDKQFPNEPMNVIEGYRKIADLRKMDLKDFEKQIEENYRKLFGVNGNGHH